MDGLKVLRTIYLNFDIIVVFCEILAELCYPGVKLHMVCVTFCRDQQKISIQLDLCFLVCSSLLFVDQVRNDSYLIIFESLYY